MSSSGSSDQYIAFFGATGGCGHACLVHTLNSGYHVSALARTPSKLSDQLKASGVSQETIDSHLTIIKGSAKDLAAVKQTLSPIDSIVSKIFFGIGGVPQLRFNLLSPCTLDDPNVCAESINTIIRALQELESSSSSAQKPLICFISACGVARNGSPRDVPIGLNFVYHYLGEVPHEDKHNLELAIKENVKGSDQSKRVFSNFVGVRPSLLTGGVTATGGKGAEKIRVGTEKKPAVGYTISRADVGEWVFKNFVKVDGEDYLGEMVTITN